MKLLKRWAYTLYPIVLFTILIFVGSIALEHFYPRSLFAPIIAAPFLAGVFMARFHPKPLPVSMIATISIQTLSMLIAIALSRISGLEGMVCLAMAIMPILFFTVLGGFFWLMVERWRVASKGTLSVFINSPLLLTGAFDFTPPTEKTYLIQDEIYIEASAKELFEFVKSIDNIQNNEINTRFSHLLGVPKPTSATWIENNDEAMRISQWTEEVEFHEVITSMQVAEFINWDFEFPKGWIAEGIEDPHVTIGGRYIDIVRGGYKFEQSGSGTIVTLWTETHDRTKLGFYAEFWHNQFIGDFQSSILELVKNRVETTS